LAALNVDRPDAIEIDVLGRIPKKLQLEKCRRDIGK
jgi:hypothetical protein